MATCANCGARLADGIKFCENCGAPLETVQPQPQPPEGHGIVRYHRVFAFLRLLWIPMLFLLYVDMATWTPLVFGDMITFDVAYLPWKFLGVVWSAVSLFIAIRASKLRFPKAGTSVVLSVLGLVSAIFVNLFLMVAEFLGSRF